MSPVPSVEPLSTTIRRSTRERRFATTRATDGASFRQGTTATIRGSAIEAPRIGQRRRRAVPHEDRDLVLRRRHGYLAGTGVALAGPPERPLAAWQVDDAGGGERLDDRRDQQIVAEHV